MSHNCRGGGLWHTITLYLGQYISICLSVLVVDIQVLLLAKLKGFGIGRHLKTKSEGKMKIL